MTSQLSVAYFKNKNTAGFFDLLTLPKQTNTNFLFCSEEIYQERHPQ